MAKAYLQRQNWAKWTEDYYLNFHDYHHVSGWTLTVVRMAPKAGQWTRQVLGKYRTKKGALMGLRKDDLKPDENPDAWWTPSDLVALRGELF